MISTEYPSYPWEKVGTDLFHWKEIEYLLVVDYFSRYIEIAKLTKTTSVAIIERLKSIFSRFGIAIIVPNIQLQNLLNLLNCMALITKQVAQNTRKEMEKQKEL